MPQGLNMTDSSEGPLFPKLRCYPKPSMVAVESHLRKLGFGSAWTKVPKDSLGI